jgi:CDP-diacylglycerol--glycerol-3-phosphate 3-phosphatidyltransferase
MTHLPTPDHLGDPNNEVPILNIPNLLTVARLFMVPIFGYLVLAVEQTDSAQWASAAVFLIAALTDLIDGVWARRYGLVTNFGKIADPIADKALIGTALIALSIQGEIAWWVTGVIVAFLIPLNGWVDAVAQMSLGVALALTITTGIDYVLKARVLPRSS